MNTKTALWLAISILTLSPMVPAQADATPIVTTCPRWEPLIKEFKMPTQWTSHIMWRESRCTERVISKPNSNGTVDIGLMQINSSWRTVTRQICKTTDHIQALRHARCNLKVARYLFDQGGKHHWRTGSAK